MNCGGMKRRGLLGARAVSRGSAHTPVPRNTDGVKIEGRGFAASLFGFDDNHLDVDIPVITCVGFPANHHLL